MNPNPSLPPSSPKKEKGEGTGRDGRTGQKILKYSTVCYANTMMKGGGGDWGEGLGGEGGWLCMVIPNVGEFFFFFFLGDPPPRGGGRLLFVIYLNMI